MLGVLCGLHAEAECFRSASNVRVACSSARLEGAKRGMDSLLSFGVGARAVTAFLSFGLAGGLVDDLPSGAALVSGQVVLATSVLTKQGEIFVDPDFLARLQTLFPEAVLGRVLGVDVMLETALAKRQAAKSGALVADMESHVLAAVARDKRISFGVLRVVADTVEMDLPPAARVPLTCLGRVDLPSVLGAVLRQPSQIPELVGLGLRTGCAMGVLRKCAQALVGG